MPSRNVCVTASRPVCGRSLAPGRRAGAATPAGRPLGAGATDARTTSRCPLRSPKSLSPSTNAPSAARGYWVNSAASAAVSCAGSA